MIVKNDFNIKVDIICKCGNRRFIKKDKNTFDITLLCTECERIYTLKTFVEEKK